MNECASERARAHVCCMVTTMIVELCIVVAGPEVLTGVRDI